MNQSPCVLLVATMDTKGKEALFLESCLKQRGTQVLILDAGIRGHCPVSAAIPREEVANAGDSSLAKIKAICWCRGRGHGGNDTAG